jgi:adenylate cyclase
VRVSAAERYGCSIEIERKFLVPEPPSDLSRWPSSAIEQGYLAVDGDGTEVRVRRRDGGAALLTVKSSGGRTRVEEEIGIEPERFERLWPLTESRRIEKTRYEIPVDGGVIELDVYAGALDGLVVAEVEFDSDEAADAFAAPRWLGPEVTDDARYKNQRLATDGAPARP